MTREQLLKKVKDLYPPGTIFKSPYSGKIVTTQNDEYSISSDLKEIHIRVIEESGSFCLLYNDMWAEVIKSVEPQINNTYEIC